MEQLLYYKFTDPQGVILRGSEVAEVRYPLPQDNQPGEWLTPGARYWGGRLRSYFLTDSDTPPHYTCFLAEGRGEIERAIHPLWGNTGSACFREVRLLRQLGDTEIDQRFEEEFARRLGKTNIYLPIAWARYATFLDRAIDQNELVKGLWRLSVFLGRLEDIYLLPKSKISSLDPLLFNHKEDGLAWALWKSMYSQLEAPDCILVGYSLQQCLWRSIDWNVSANIYEALGKKEVFGQYRPRRDDALHLEDSLTLNVTLSIQYEKLFSLVGRPKPELEDLVGVLKSGALPLGWYEGKFICFTP